MAIPIPEPGLVIGYAYLWRAEHERGQEEGMKDRPCAIVLKVQGAGGETIVTVVPITHTPPKRPDEAIELPLPTKQRLGLDTARSWIIASEVNRFVWPGPDLRPISRSQTDRFSYGLLPPALFRQLKEKLAACAHSQRLRAVLRSE